MKFTIYGSGGWFFKTEKRSFREIGEKYRSRTTLKKFIWKPWSTQSSHRQYSSESNSGRHNASGFSSRVLSQTFSLFSIFCMISSFLDMTRVPWALNAARRRGFACAFVDNFWVFCSWNISLYGNHRYVIFVLCSAELFFRLWKSSFLHKNNLGDPCSVFTLTHADFGDIRVDAKTKKWYIEWIFSSNFTKIWRKFDKIIGLN